jgi:hypothetical protein
MQTLENLSDQCEYYRACLLDQRQLSVPSPERHAVLLAAMERHAGDLAALGSEHVLNGMTAILAALGHTA